MIIRVMVVLPRTVVSVSHFDNLSGLKLNLQSQVNSVCQSMIYLYVLSVESGWTSLAMTVLAERLV